MIKRLVLLLFLMHYTAFAQKPTHISYTIDNGLPSNEVHDVELAADGHLWLATNRGVTRYDGRRFENFTTEDGLVDNTVHEIVEDANGRIWFIGYSLLLAYYEDGEIHPYDYNHIIAELVTPRNLYLDFFASASGSITYSLKGTRSFEIAPDGALRFLENLADSCGVDLQLREGKTLFYTNSCGEKNYLRIDHDGLTKQFNLERDRREYAAVISDQQWVFSVNGQDLYFRNADEFTLLHRFKTSLVSVFWDGEAIWVGTPEGLCRISLSTGKRQWYLTDEFISGIEGDGKNGLWVTTLYNGVFYMPNTRITVFSAGYGLEDEKVSTLFQDSKGRIFVGGFDGGVSIIADGKVVRSFSGYPDQQNVVRGFVETEDGQIYFVSTGMCLHRILDLEPPQSLCTMLGSRSTMRKLIYSEDEIIIGASGGLDRLMLKPTLGLSTFVKDLKLNVISLCRRTASELLVGTNGAIFSVNLNTRERRDLTNESVYFRNRIVEMKPFSNEMAAMATEGSGLLLYDADTVMRISLQEGLRSANLTSVDVNGSSIWLGSERGLTRVDVYSISPFIYTMEHYTKHDGLASDYVNSISASDSTVWVGSNDGVTAFKWHLARAKMEAPQVLISGVTVNGDELGATDSLAFASDQNRVGIRFKGLSIRGLNDAFYKYKLMGMSEDWVTTKETEVLFAALAPGDYRFEVLACNANEECSPSPAVYHFSIDTPFYLKWWFILLEGLAVISLMALVSFIRARGIKERIQQKESATRLKLEYELKALRSQLNPHFIFNALTSIQDYILRGDIDASSQYLARFARLMRSILDSSRTDRVTIETDLNATRAYLDLERQLFDGLFDYAIDVKDVDVEHWMIPSLLIQPYVENAIMHGLRPLNKGGFISIRLKKEGDWVLCEVEDNGVGRLQSTERNARSRHAHVSHGSDIGNERIHLLAQLQGKHINVDYEDLKDEKGSSIGTLVSIRFPILLG
ncbi:MAG: histidine kinase [Cryomorphaceae bacterium]